MDPLSALSVAASVVQFVVFARDLVKLINDTASSGNSQTSHLVLKSHAKKLLSLNTNMQRIVNPASLGRLLTPAEEAVNETCNDCAQKADDLINMLEELE